MAIALAPDGGRLASAICDKSVRVWDLCDPEAPALILAGHHDGVSWVAFSPDGNGLASAGLDKTVRVWDLLQPKAPALILVRHQADKCGRMRLLWTLFRLGTDRRDDSAALPDREYLVGLHPGEPFDLARGRPLHFHDIDGLDLAQTEVQAQVTLRHDA